MKEREGRREKARGMTDTGEQVLYKVREGGKGRGERQGEGEREKERESKYFTKGERE